MKVRAQLIEIQRSSAYLDISDCCDPDQTNGGCNEKQYSSVNKSIVLYYATFS